MMYHSFFLSPAQEQSKSEVKLELRDIKILIILCLWKSQSFTNVTIGQDYSLTTLLKMFCAISSFTLLSFGIF